MKISTINRGYINVTGEIYDSEFLNLANVVNEKVEFDDRTLFLNADDKKKLNNSEIKLFKDSLIIMKNKGKYSLIANLPISEYRENRVKSHELVIPEIVQGMISNYHGYNVETAPVMLLHKEKIHLKSFVLANQADYMYCFEDVEIYIYSGDTVLSLKKLYSSVEELFIGDGHHRLYSTSLYERKTNVLSMLISIDEIEIFPINRELIAVEEEEFESSFEFIKSKFDIHEVRQNKKPSSGKVIMEYKGHSYEITLIELMSDAFWNNDVYRLNTQIITQAFRVFDNTRLKFFFDDLELEKKYPKSVYFKLAPMTKEDFVMTAEKGNILPPKTTFMYPKSPSFLIMSSYKE